MKRTVLYDTTPTLWDLGDGRGKGSLDTPSEPVCSLHSTCLPVYLHVLLSYPSDTPDHRGGATLCCSALGQARSTGKCLEEVHLGT